MAYTPQTWHDYPATDTPINKAALDYIEGGIQAAASTADSAQAGLANKVNVADAVALSTTTPAPPLVGGYAGTGNTASRGDHAHPPLPGVVYPLPGGVAWVHPVGAQTGTASCSNVKCPVTPFPVPRRMQVTAFGMRPYTVGDAGSGKIALYASATNGLPTGAPIWTSDPFTVTAGDKVITPASTLILDPGLYFLACGSYGFTTTRMVPRALESQGIANQYLVGVQSAPSSPTTVAGVFLSGFNEATGAFPTLTAAVADYVTGGGVSAWWYAINATAA